MTGSTRSRATRFTFAIVGVLVLYVVGVIVRHQLGIRVIISNESGEALRQVSVKIESIGDRGKRSNLYYLAPGGRVRVYAQPVTESRINLEFMDARNKLHTETLGTLRLGIAELQRQQFYPETRSTLYLTLHVGRVGSTSYDTFLTRHSASA